MILFALCVSLAWDPSAGATGYEIRRDGVVQAITQAPTVIACAPDLYTPHTYTVIGTNDTGQRSEESDPLTLEWRWQLDLNADGVVGFADLAPLMSRVNDAWGTCNNGQGESNCGQ